MLDIVDARCNHEDTNMLSRFSHTVHVAFACTFDTYCPHIPYIYSIKKSCQKYFHALNIPERVLSF